MVKVLSLGWNTMTAIRKWLIGVSFFASQALCSMKTRFRWVITIGAGVWLFAPSGLLSANAAGRDVQSLYNACQKSSASQEFALCTGYISGVGEMLMLLGGYKKNHPKEAGPFAICDAPSFGAMGQAFIDWAERNPQERAREQISGVVLALTQKWPCKPN